MQGKKLYVGNLDYSVTDEDLKELFAPYGEVKYVKLIEDRGFGFVEMGSQSEAEKARQALNGTKLKERALKIDEARPQRNRGRGRY